jgi:hypothetical protein
MHLAQFKEFPETSAASTDMARIMSLLYGKVAGRF